MGGLTNLSANEKYYVVSEDRPVEICSTLAEAAVFVNRKDVVNPRVIVGFELKVSII